MTIRDLVILGCSSQQPTRFRNHGAYLIRWNDEGLLFDPGEGTQRQFIFANVSPTHVNRIFISHFHGDHCLGLGSFLMRLNLDQVNHPIHCYYPASGKKFFDRLRFSTIYHERIEVIEHPVSQSGIVEETGTFTIEAAFLNHGVDCIGWRITEPSSRKYDPAKLKAHGVRGPLVKELELKGALAIEGKTIHLEHVSWIRPGDSIAVVLDTRECPAIYHLAQDARLFLCESTYLNSEKELAYQNHHLTATQAALIAQKCNVKQLVLTHFSARYLRVSDFAKEARTIFPNTEAAEDFKIIPFPK